MLIFLAILLLLVPSWLAVIYYLAFVTARLLGWFDRSEPTDRPRHRFLVLIPAHNEEQLLGRTLRSCRQLNYPPDLVHIVVVADNCTDDTVAVARAHGVTCWERQDRQRKGKGHALQWGLSRALQGSADAVVILDADSPIAPDALRHFDRCLRQGDLVLQANHRVANADVNAISYAASVGRVLEYDLFFAPKSHFRLAVLLVGTGMVLHRQVLQRYRWTASSCAEDTEYTLILTRAGQRVRFVADTYVESYSATSATELGVQRLRWARGNLKLSRTRAVRMIVRGCYQRNVRMVDTGLTLLVQSRPLVLMHALLSAAACVLLPWLWPHVFPPWLAVAGGLLLPAYWLYLACGILFLGLSRRRLGHLLGAPWVIVRLTLLTLRSVIGTRHETWIRTPRNCDAL